MAIEQAEKYGLLGDNILNSGVNFHLHINRGAGAFVCGEGSALTASIEGNRGMPRVKPPRTVEKGLWGKPTVLNNVETYANVPKIILQGADWFRTIGTEGSPGTKTFSLTGSIENTGLIEVPMGTTLRHIIYDIGGGLKSGAAFKGVQIGGPSGGCLILDQLDAPLDFDSVKKLDAIMGSGGLVVMDENTCMVEVARFFMNFTQRESCGKCVPCREGTKRMLEILERIVDGKGEMSDLDELEELANMVQNMALCGLGKSAPLPVISTLKRFRDEYEEHICDKKCRAKVCIDILPDIFLYIAFHLLYLGKCTEIQIHFSSSIPMLLDKLQSLSDILPVLHFYDTLLFLFFRSLLVDIVFLRLLSHPTYVLKLDHVF